ncbi:LVIVD repeat-containing protein [Winogradskyella bathintestinalis]|uniref:LVIVD repeat-containing protein n=1 Tax=Winogradskyella bathintestinalis TaxID=3035208 RepID=A0ABT7ZVX6_9FLAO|nr:hypothetical protein [Winogradskyella bathintestinalis]MDN3493091.1 hypothetical protein [Winogradskyella bathintestinalis]
MKNKISPLVFALIICLLLVNCNSDDDSSAFIDPVTVTIPVIKSKSEMRNSITIMDPQPTNSDGKIYVYDDLLFYIAQNSGIHIFNNQNPENPQNIAFIQLEGVNDISVKNDILYADKFMDLVVFDISSMSDIQLVNIEEDMLVYYAIYPDGVEYYQSDISPANEDEFIATYSTVDMERTDVENNPNFYYWGSEIFISFNDAALANNVGVGGSYAKFQIYDNALYTLDDYKLNTFDISDYNNITLTSETWMGGWFGGELETTYILKENLFIGATNGMHIISLEDEFNPIYTSSFTHATGCDPVVVENFTAYITVRGGNSCGAIEDQINVIDVSNLSAPVEYSTYFLSSPYGLGIKEHILYVCNEDGINVFDAQNPNNIILKNTYVTTSKDVIPLSSHLIAVGNNVIQQYNYVDNFGLELISTLQF